MAIGIVSDEDFDKELNNCIHKDIIRGRNGALETPEIVRDIIAEEVLTTNKTQAQIADEMGISKSSVSAYAHDATSTASYNEPDKRLKKHNDVVRNNIISGAKQKLLEALSNITPDKMEGAKLRDIASVAKDMSAVVKNMEPQSNSGSVNAQFIFHVPKQKPESDFEVIDVTQ